MEFFSPSHHCTVVVKRVSNSQFLNRSRVSKTRDAIFLNHLKRSLTYYIEPPYYAKSQKSPKWSQPLGSTPHKFIC